MCIAGPVLVRVAIALKWRDSSDDGHLGVVVCGN